MNQIINVTQTRLHPLSVPRLIRVCAYVRVSTSHSEQLVSLQNQTEYYQQKLNHNPCQMFVGIFSDAGISGAKTNRPGFQAMLQKAKAGELDLIYTKSISRFARNTLMLLQTVRDLKAIGVGILFEEENIHTLSETGELMLSILASIAEEERTTVRSNVQWAMRNKFLRGEVLVDTNRLLGFTKDPYGDLIIVPEQAEIVRRIFRLYLDGMPACTIAKVLNELGIPSYRNNLWNSSRVRSIIANEKYAGDCLQQKTFINESGQQIPNRGQRDQYWIDNAHPAIISRSDWDQAQLTRKVRGKSVYPFFNLLVCSFCGSTLIRSIVPDGYASWVCNKYLHQGEAACIGTRITESCLFELSKDQPITEPMIVEEVNHDPAARNRRQKSHRLIPGSSLPDNKPAGRERNTRGGLLPGVLGQ